MKQVYVVHSVAKRGDHGPGRNEVWVGPYSAQEANRRAKAHRHMPDNAITACRVQVQPYDGGKAFLPVCSPGCADCRHGYHDEVRDA